LGIAHGPGVRASRQLADPLHLVIQTPGDIGTAGQIAIIDVGILLTHAANQDPHTVHLIGHLPAPSVGRSSTVVMPRFGHTTEPDPYLPNSGEIRPTGYHLRSRVG
jgi:hypothetical protein